MSKAKKASVLAISMGDPAGIGPEVIVKALAKKSMRGKSRYIIVGNKYILEAAASGRGLSYAEIHDIDAFLRSGRRVGLVDIPDKRLRSIARGKVSPLAGRASVHYVENALELCVHGKADALVTGPINKESIYAAGYYWAGHTELLSDLTESPDVVMMLAGGRLRVALVTTHLALKHVFKSLSKERIARTIRITSDALRKYFRIRRPRIGVAGLNPHAGDGGRFGREEIEIIAPAVKEARSRKIRCEGPLSPDAIFVKALDGAFDAVVAMYHDQGLIPLKSHAFGSSVNITLGLPIIRTSVDHGTAFDIVGKGIADPSSLVAAIETALVMTGASK
jgi:4-hydroxythreonine-4-phosphate dehydrogenase